MKKIILSTLLLSFCFVVAQKKEKDSLAFKAEGGIYIGIGGTVQNGFNINQKLINSNLATIPDARPEFIIGINGFGEKFSGSFELATNYSDRKVGNNRTMFMSSNARFNFSYNLINKPKVAFATGLNLVYSYSQVNIFNANSVIDLNNLNPLLANGSNTILYNNMFYVGPAVSLYLFKKTNWEVRVNAAYEIGLSRGSWKSEFVNVNNTVNERGINRFIFGITLL